MGIGAAFSGFFKNLGKKIFTKTAKETAEHTATSTVKKISAKTIGKVGAGAFVSIGAVIGVDSLLDAVNGDNPISNAIEKALESALGIDISDGQINLILMAVAILGILGLVFYFKMRRK